VTISDPEEFAGVARRHFIAVATSQYTGRGFPPLPRVSVEVATLRAWLCAEALTDRRFVEPHPSLADSPTKKDLETVFAASRNRGWRSGTAAFVFVTGHGIIDGAGTHWTILKDADHATLFSKALRTADLAGWLSENGPDHLILVLDSCYSGAALTGITGLPRSLPKNWLVLPSATRDGTAQTCAVTDAVHEVLAELARPEGQSFGLEAHLKVEDFVSAIQAKLDDEQHLQPLGKVYGRHVCLPNPHYRPPSATATEAARRDLALPQADLDSHWGPRSRGVTDAAEAGWLFTGRAALMRRLITAATGDPGVLLVTGGAGSGKSAVLARLVTLSDPTFRTRYAEEVARIPTGLAPPENAVNVAVLATGKNAPEILTQVCRATGALPADAPDPAFQIAQQAWKDWIASSYGPVTIVVDALDEATNPTEVLTGALTHLRAGPAAGRVRLLVGVRSLGGPSTPTPGPSTGAALALDAAAAPSLGATGRGRRQLADLAQDHLAADPDQDRVRVDENPWWVHVDVADYVTSLLLAPEDSPYRPYRGDEAATKAVADVLAEAAGPSFLVAKLAAEHLARQPHVVDPDDPAWRASISRGVLGVFRADLHADLPDPEDRLRAVHLLRAVAFAYGRGLPWRTIWPLVANAVADEPGRYGDSDIAWLLNHTRMGGYLVTDTEDDTTVYRLFHDDLRTTLREHWHELLDGTES
jgi:hypothetical protein